MDDTELELAMQQGEDPESVEAKRHIPVAVRVGLHRGACMGCVAGTNQPRYCIFGGVVNITSRLETSSEAMRVHVSLKSHIINRLLDVALWVESRCLHSLTLDPEHQS